MNFLICVYLRKILEENRYMESKKTYEREIALQDLYWKIILDWLPIIDILGDFFNTCTC